jgi:hypothetical protein
MARKAARPRPRVTEHLTPLAQDCPACGRRLWADYRNYRAVAALDGPVGLTLDVRRCHHPGCPRHLKPYRPEAEGRYALPQHELGLDVIALVGALRYAEHRSLPEVHQHLVGRGLAIAERTVTNLLDRYDELLAVSLTDDRRLRGLLAGQGRVILAIDGLPPDVGHEVLWGLRDCLSGEVLLARSLLSGRQRDLAGLLGQVRDGLRVPIAGVVSDGQHPVRQAVAEALPGVPHRLCQFHYLLPARGGPATVRGGPPRQEGVEEARPRGAAHRAVAGGPHRCRGGSRARLLRRGPQRPDGRRAAAVGGLEVEAAPAAVGGHGQPGPGGRKKGLPAELQRLRALLTGGLAATAALWPALQVVYAWVRKAAHALGDKGPGTAAGARQQLGGLLGAMARHRAAAGHLGAAVDHFVKVTRRYWAGLFHCYAVGACRGRTIDLEQFFGSRRYHERRASGRKAASPALVLRGEARLLAAAATRRRTDTAAELAGTDPGRRQELRQRLEGRRRRRVQRSRFRGDPRAFLHRLEAQLLQSALPT